MHTMIQRIQTVFLFFVALSMLGILFFPLWQKMDLSSSEIATMDAFFVRFEKFGDGNENSVVISKMDVWYMIIPAILSAVVAIISIFTYKNRLRQIQFGALNSLLIATTMGLALFFIQKAERLLALDLQGNYLFGFYLPVSALLFNLLANRFIRRDESLVRSADRIR